jgi:hypothetical protein
VVAGGDSEAHARANGDELLAVRELHGLARVDRSLQGEPHAPEQEIERRPRFAERGRVGLEHHGLGETSTRARRPIERRRLSPLRSFATQPEAELVLPTRDVLRGSGRVEVVVERGVVEPIFDQIERVGARRQERSGRGHERDIVEITRGEPIVLASGQEHVQRWIDEELGGRHGSPRERRERAAPIGDQLTRSTGKRARTEQPRSGMG